MTLQQVPRRSNGLSAADKEKYYSYVNSTESQLEGGKGGFPGGFRPESERYTSAILGKKCNRDLGVGHKTSAK